MGMKSVWVEHDTSAIQHDYVSMTSMHASHGYACMCCTCLRTIAGGVAYNSPGEEIYPRMPTELLGRGDVFLPPSAVPGLTGERGRCP